MIVCCLFAFKGTTFIIFHYLLTITNFFSFSVSVFESKQSQEWNKIVKNRRNPGFSSDISEFQAVLFEVWQRVHAQGRKATTALPLVFGVQARVGMRFISLATGFQTS